MGFLLGCVTVETMSYLCDMLRLLKILVIFIAVGAVGGAVMMWVDPAGTNWGGEPLLEMLRSKMPWPDFFFRDFKPSGYVLLAAIGLPHLLSAVMLFKRHQWAYWVSLASGIVLMIWIGLEWWVWGLNPMSNIFFVLGLAEALLAVVGIKKG